MGPLLALLCFAAPAQEPAETPPAPPPGATTPELARGYTFEIDFRSRYVFVPASIIDIWYFQDSEQEAAGATSPDRPNIRGYGLGLELVVKSETANGMFYVDWMSSTMGQGYWDDREGLGDEVYDDGEYLVPDDNLALLAFGANYAYEAHLVRTADTDGAFGLSFLVGGGLGVGFMIGGLDVWTYDDDTSTPAYVRYENEEEPDGRKAIPRVYPMVDINAGLRFNFGDRVVLRVEGGLHTLLYAGASVGVMF